MQQTGRKSLNKQVNATSFLSFFDVILISPMSIKNKKKSFLC